MKRSTRLSRFLPVLSLLAFLALLAGCGQDRPECVPAAGQVFIDGQPLTAGQIRVIPSGARAASAKIDQEGRFTLTTFESGDGCVPGTHAVEITALDTTGDRMVQLVPEKYGRADTSGLTVTVDGSTDSLRIDLTWEGQQPASAQTEGGGDADPANL